LDPDIVLIALAAAILLLMALVVSIPMTDPECLRTNNARWRQQRAINRLPVGPTSDYSLSLNAEAISHE
jgi:hypothetical protein